MASAVDIREFLRKLVLDPSGRALIARQVGTSERVMVEALKLAASDPNSETNQLPVSVDVRILAAITAMPPEIQKTYAETGKLPERYWEAKKLE